MGNKDQDRGRGAPCQVTAAADDVVPTDVARGLQSVQDSARVASTSATTQWWRHAVRHGEVREGRRTSVSEISMFPPLHWPSGLAGDRSTSRCTRGERSKTARNAVPGHCRTTTGQPVGVRGRQAAVVPLVMGTASPAAAVAVTAAPAAAAPRCTHLHPVYAR